MAASDGASGNDHGVLTRTRVQAEIRDRLLSLRQRLSTDLWPAFDALLERRGFLSSEADPLFHPLGHPIASFPTWVAAAVGRDGGDGEALVLDLIEATVAGYLYVRVHDDRLDEGIGDPDESLFLADAFLVRHQTLLVRHVGSSPRFWDLFEQVAAEYAAAMLLERTVMRVGATYGPDEFDLVLGRSRPLVLPGVAVLDVADRWDLVEPLQRFVHHAVRAAQLVDDLLDCEVDRAAGRLTWVVRRLGGEAGAAEMVHTLLAGGVDEIVAEAIDDVAASDAAAAEVGMVDARAWLAARRAEIVALHETDPDAIPARLAWVGRRGRWEHDCEQLRRTKHSGQRLRGRGVGREPGLDKEMGHRSGVPYRVAERPGSEVLRRTARVRLHAQSGHE